jgi:hypothetical protein
MKCITIPLKQAQVILIEKKEMLILVNFDRFLTDKTSSLSKLKDKKQLPKS